MSELNKHMVALLQLVQYGLPSSFGDETLCATAIPCVVFDNHSAIKEQRQDLPPSPLRSADEWLVGHGRITDEKEPNGSLTLEPKQAQNGENND
jgi:hypothetical protein